MLVHQHLLADSRNLWDDNAYRRRKHLRDNWRAMDGSCVASKERRMNEYEVGEIPPEELEKQKKRPYFNEDEEGE